MASVDYSYRLRYFDKVGERYAVKKALKELVHFDFHNLKTEYLPQRNDVIFCRNVMMYFDEAEQKRLVDKFCRCLNPDGYLFVGHAESLLGLTDKFPMVHRNSGTAYQRVEVTIVSQSRRTRRGTARTLLRKRAGIAASAERRSAEAGKASRRPRNLRSIRRTVHTLKGDAAACGFRELSELAHELEDALALESVSAHAAARRSCFCRGRPFRRNAGRVSEARQSFRHASRCAK